MEIMSVFEQQELDCVTIPEKLTPTQRAEKYHYLPPTSEIKGLWNSQYVPFMRGILDTFANHSVREIYFKKPTQTTGTEAIIICALWAMQYYPGDILFISADTELSQYTNKKRFQPVMKQDKYFSGLVDIYTESEIKLKTGFSIYFYTAQSMGAALGRPFRYVFLDEIDRWQGIKEIGNMIQTFRERMTTFDYAKMFCISTPLFEISHINTLYNSANEQYDYFIQCPTCKGSQPLRYSAKSEYPSFIDDTGETKNCGYVIWEGGIDATSQQINEAGYCCAYCGYIMSTQEKNIATLSGVWKPRIIYDGEIAKVGFHLSRLYSVLRAGKFSNIVSDYLVAKQGDVTDLQSYINNTLAESFKIQLFNINKIDIKEKQTKVRLAIPSTCLALTMGIDVQAHSFYYTVWGWEFTSTGYRGYLVDYVKLTKNWNLLKEKIFDSDYDGHKIWRAMIDSGGSRVVDSDLSMTEEVYQFVRKIDPLQKKLWVVKGKDSISVTGQLMWFTEPEQMRPKPGLPIRRLHGSIRLWRISTWDFFDIFYNKLNKKNEINENSLTFLCETDKIFLDHITSHENVAEKGKSIWKIRKGYHDHDWLDASIYALACVNSQASGGLNILKKVESSVVNQNINVTREMPKMMGPRFRGR